MRIFSSERCLRHPAPPGFPECPARLERLLERFGRESAFDLRLQGPFDAERAARARAAIAAVHEGGPDGLVERFERAASRGDSLLDTPDNPIGRASFDAALAAVETTLTALDEAMAEPAAPVFAALRPPGHHAERGSAMGFCFFNNVAVAAREAQRRHGLARIAIFDFDVHHGNGTQHLFEDDPTVLYISTHQFPFYPGTGAATERGIGAGEGATLNVPLPAGSGDDAYRRALHELVLPELERFAPDLLIVSAGFDAWKSDPLGGMRVSAAGFAEWGSELAAFARQRTAGRLLSVLEGGYDLDALPDLVAGYLAAQGAP